MSTIIDRIFSGSCQPCNDLERAILDGRITAVEAGEAVRKRYGGSVRSVREGAAMETAHMKALDV